MAVTLADALPSPAAPVRRPRRRAAATAGVVGVVAVIGGGAWAWHAWSAQGAQPAEALPADTLAYVAVDLAPPGGQKVAAYNALKKFPSLEKELGLGSQDDLRESFVDTLNAEGDCDLSWSEVKGWAGDRGALAVVPAKTPDLVVALQITDPDKARASLKKIATGCDDEEFGFALDDKWAVIAETEEIARRVQSEAKGATLAEDSDFQELTGAAGDPGVVTLYAAPEAGDALLDAIEEDPFLGFVALSPIGVTDPISTLVTFATFTADFSDFEDSAEAPSMTPEEKALWKRMDHYDELTPAEQRQLDKELEAFFERQEVAEPFEDVELDDDGEYDFAPDLSDSTRASLRDFSGLGGSVRFENGGLQVEVVTDPFLTGYDRLYDGTDALEALAALPSDTVVAFGAGFADGWADDVITRAGSFGSNSTEDEVIDSFQESTGLSPDDLESLGGETVAFVAGADFVKSLEAEDIDAVPLAARITGDQAKIEAALATLTAKSPVTSGLVSVRTDDGVVIGVSRSYLEKVAHPKETLGDTGRLDDALADGEDAMIATYADLDAGSWLSDASEGDVTRKDADALDSMGITVREDGQRHRLVAKVALD